MSDNSFKARKGLTLSPVNPSTLVNPEAGDIVSDSTDSNKIKRWNGSAWVELGGSVAVEKDNTSVMSTASIFNFEGTPFAVSDAGGGQANIKIGPEINFDPVNLSTITTPIDGDLACDINAQYAIKRYNAATSTWVSNISNLVYGDVDDGLNLGAGTGIFAQKLAQNLEFKSLVAGTNMSLTNTTTEVTITTTAEINTASNVGTGTGVFKQKTLANLEFKSLLEGSNIAITSGTNELTLAAKNVATPALNWVKDTLGPISEFIDGFLFESFDNVSVQEIYVVVNVPPTYVAGTQIFLKQGKFFCAGASPSTVQFQAVSALINASTVLGTYSNTYTSTNAAVTLSATTNLITSIGNIDLTNASGQINAVAVQAGDKIRVKLYRVAGGATQDARLLLDSLELTFG